jgi:hypothetical protein
MAKRFTDTDKWRKNFIKGLPIEYKAFWIYILDDCDFSGIWHVDIEVAELRLGVKLSLEKARGFFKERVVEFDNENKWFIPGFIEFQYGLPLSEKQKAHISVKKNLIKNSLIGYLEGIYTHKDKDKAKDKDKDKDKDKGGIKGNEESKKSNELESPPPPPKPTVDSIEKRIEKFRESLVPFLEKYGKEMIKEFFNYWSEKNKSGTKMRWELNDTWETSKRLVTWEKNNSKFEGPTKPKQQEQERELPNASDLVKKYM